MTRRGTPQRHRRGQHGLGIVDLRDRSADDVFAVRVRDHARVDSPGRERPVDRECERGRLVGVRRDAVDQRGEQVRALRAHVRHADGVFLGTQLTAETEYVAGFNGERIAAQPRRKSGADFAQSRGWERASTSDFAPVGREARGEVRVGTGLRGGGGGEQARHAEAHGFTGDRRGLGRRFARFGARRAAARNCRRVFDLLADAAVGKARFGGVGLPAGSRRRRRARLLVPLLAEPVCR